VHAPQGRSHVDTEVTVRAGSPAGRLTVVVTTAVLLGGASSVTLSASLGKHSIVRSTFMRSGRDIRGTADLGVGFRSVRHVELATSDGGQLAGTIDGRAVSVSGTAGGVDSLVFADGAPAPRLKTKRAVARALAKAKKALQSASCAPARPPRRRVSRTPSSTPATAASSAASSIRNPDIGLCCEPDGTVCGGTDCCPPGWTMCCPSATQCCSSGECCAVGDACCGDPPACHPGYQCIH
jgi:hypothetical protein